jgi:hypothetical protein
MQLIDYGIEDTDVFDLNFNYIEIIKLQFLVRQSNFNIDSFLN